MNTDPEHLASHDPLQPHSHDNNPQPPDNNPTIYFYYLPQDSPSQDKHAAASKKAISLADLMADYVQTVIPAYTYMTDHGIHGPYKLEGVALLDLIEQEVGKTSQWNSVEVVSADGFGNRLMRDELVPADNSLGLDYAPALICHRSNGEMLRRMQGLVRLVVPTETDNALRQVKWVREIRLA
ncbi:MAG: hypothetical protein ACI9EW_002816 [Cellvibrionaceae bacterium]|jgi:hypothetical protein